MGTLVCVASHHRSFTDLLADPEFLRVRADARCLVELRVDRYADASLALLQQTLAHFGAERCVVTCRHDDEGGGGCAAALDRVGFLEAACAAGAAYVDVELRTLRADARVMPRLRASAGAARTRIVVSYHDFVSMPPLSTLHGVCRDAAALDADVVKVALQANRVDDTATLLDLLETPGVSIPLLGIAMGEAGVWSRLLAPRWGSPAPFGFARASAAPGTAPGQPTWGDLLELYRYNAQAPTWPVLGVMGSPIAHSRSPRLHNRALAKLGLPGVYVPFLVDGCVDTFLERVAPRLGVTGLSVTLPHKEAVLKHCARLSALAKGIGAVNTLVRAPDATWAGDNTDADAAADALEDVFGGLHKRTVVVLGAGGAAKAVAHGVAARGAEVLVCNRDPTRGAQLAQAVHGRTVARDALGQLRDVKAVVQCTPVGMHPNVGVSPLSAAELPEGAAVFDTIYTPEVTEIMRLAREKGLATLGGRAMFLRQAAAQFRMFTGRELSLSTWEHLFDG